jgi:hypothetical protein
MINGTIMRTSIGFISSFILFPGIALGYFNNQEAGVVIGQKDMISSDSAASDKSLTTPIGVYTDGTRLFITDTGNHRCLIYNNLPNENNTAADLVIGQSAMNAGNSNLFNWPYLSYGSGTRLFISDDKHNRILVFNSVPTANNTAPDFAIGQPDLIQTSSGLGPNHLFWATYVRSDGVRLIVPDSSNHRVLIYNSIPNTSGASADIVLGQPDFNTNSAGLGANKFYYPQGNFLANGKLIIADSGNNRVLIYNSIPNTHNASADVVIGQINMDTNTAGCTATKLSVPEDVFVENSRLFVTDLGNNRVLIYNTIPTTNGAAADIVLGQPDMQSNAAGCTDKNFFRPSGIFGGGNKLFIADYLNNRVLIFSDTITLNSASLSQGAMGSQVSITLSGAGLGSNMTVKLSNGMVELAAYKIMTYSFTSATCLFNLNVFPGKFDIKVERPGSTPGILSGAFTILSAQPTPTPVPTTASAADFKGKIIDEKYFYVYPNPTHGVNVKFRFFLPQSADVKIKIFTTSEKFVWETGERNYPAGWSELAWNASGMSNGVYFYIGYASNDKGREKIIKKLVLLK